LKQGHNFLPTNSFKTLYFAMMHPHITYGILAWGNASSSILNKSIKLQKRTIRLIYKVEFNAHTELLFKRANILTLGDKSRSNFDPVILSSGICSPYKSRSSIGFKYWRKKLIQSFQTHNVSKCVVNISISSPVAREIDREKHTHTHTHAHGFRFGVITNKQNCHTKHA